MAEWAGDAGVMSYDNFLRYMVTVLGDTDTKEEILSSFSVLCQYKVSLPAVPHTMGKEKDTSELTTCIYFGPRSLSHRWKPCRW